MEWKGTLETYPIDYWNQNFALLDVVLRSETRPWSALLCSDTDVIISHIGLSWLNCGTGAVTWAHSLWIRWSTVCTWMTLFSVALPITIYLYTQCYHWYVALYMDMDTMCYEQWMQCNLNRPLLTFWSAKMKIKGIGVEFSITPNLTKVWNMSFCLFVELTNVLQQTIARP